MQNLWKKWIFIAQFHFQDPDPDSEYGSGSGAIRIRNRNTALRSTGRSTKKQEKVVRKVLCKIIEGATFFWKRLLPSLFCLYSISMCTVESSQVVGLCEDHAEERPEDGGAGPGLPRPLGCPLLQQVLRGGDRQQGAAPHCGND